MTENTNLEVLTFSTSTNLQNPNPNLLFSFNKLANQRKIAKEKKNSRNISGECSILFHIKFNNKIDVLTLIDFSISDHCFANKSLFMIYSLLSPLFTRLSIEKDSTFRILGKESIKL